MIIHDRFLLSSLTTLRVGGAARFVIECTSREEVWEAVTFAREQKLPWSVLGAGSNVLAKDDGYEGVVIVLRIPGIAASITDESVTLTAGAGVTWDTLVTEAAARNLWGLENLAGIPGTVGAAPVQNIGAYGAEVKDTVSAVEVLDTETGEISVLSNEECAFGYRDSRFKQDARFVILAASFRLMKSAEPNVKYKDLETAREQGVVLDTPSAIGEAVRAIRARKFPDLTKVGTAGSFFKNPTISKEAYALLKEGHRDLPGFPNENGVKIPLAFVLDHILNMRGYTVGNVSLFERQPLVLVARDGATANEVGAFANSIAERVLRVTGIIIEREVRNFPW